MVVIYHDMITNGDDNDGSDDAYNYGGGIGGSDDGERLCQCFSEDHVSDLS